MAPTTANVWETNLPKSDLTHKEANLSALVENTADIIWSIDKNFRFLICNSAFRKLVESRKGYAPMPGDIIEYDYFPTQSAELWQDYYQMAFDGKRFSTETPVKDNGISKTIEHSFNPILGENQDVIGVTVFGRDISIRKTVERELISARKKAEEASRAKAEFLSTMSHEIRTPLNAVIGITHLLQNESPRKDQKEYLETLKFSSENLLALVNDVLDYNKIVEGKIQMEEIDFDLKELTMGIKHSFILKAAEKNVDFKVTIDDDVPTFLKGDKVRIAQVLNNLVGNAIKFTEKGHIDLTVSLGENTKKAACINFSVADTGIGIPKDKLDSIFDRFTQASSDISRKFGGTGLGLAITRKLLELLTSEIHVESEYGKGSRFYFSLCLQKCEVYGNQMAKNQRVNNPAERNLRGLRVLLVDDNQVNQLVASEFLKRWNVQLRVASSGKMAVDIVKKNDFDLILMDLQMPAMDGYTASKAIKEIVGKDSIPVVALTANTLQEVQKEVRNTGMCDIITKPFDPNELYAKLSQYTGKHPGVHQEKELWQADGLNITDNIKLHEIVQGNDQFLRSIVTSFVAELGSFKDKYRETLQKGNLKNFKAAKHKISPSLKLFEAKPLESLINIGESLLTTDTKTGIKLGSHVQEVHNQIEKMMLKLRYEGLLSQSTYQPVHRKLIHN
ncbi:ATP-binding protein [Fulvivirgaceae bacterium BMA12]|uniref:histidine kinase n=2 Tax=Agaribacillus aureus TaxID=3051825 RepID=A0ABT8LGG6_9BACT|nr:ATP-binding protein [Fulvivirgaceae bacterium BMA12]